MDRAYLSLTAGAVQRAGDDALYGQLAKKLPFAVEPTQRSAWEYQIGHAAARWSAQCALPPA